MYSWFILDTHTHTHKIQLAGGPTGNLNNLGTKNTQNFIQELRGKETCELEKIELKTNSCGLPQLGDANCLETGGCRGQRLSEKQTIQLPYFT